MESKQILTILICFSVFDATTAQRKAKQKCSEYVYHKMQPPSIIGGTTTSQNEFPHMAALGYGSSHDPEWLCGGTLISDQHVLTAAHCTTVRHLGSVNVVRLGTTHLNLQRHGPHQDIKVHQIVVHPHYHFPAAYNDIALLKLERKVEFSKTILPGCLNTGFNTNLATNSLIALGWGRTEYAGPTSDNLLQVQLRTSHSRECDRSYGRSSRDKLPSGIRDETQLCAGAEIEKDTCQGDSGGPLEYKNGRFHYIVGITSFGRACGISRTPGVYTRVSAFVPWIESVVWP